MCTTKILFVHLMKPFVHPSCGYLPYLCIRKLEVIINN